MVDESLHRLSGVTLSDSRSLRLSRLGDFEILREIGRGAMGVVYEARQISLDRHVAIKVLPTEVTSDALPLQRFKREARALAALNHPNIVTIQGRPTRSRLGKAGSPKVRIKP